MSSRKGPPDRASSTRRPSARSRRRPSASGAWLSGLVLGAISGLLSISFVLGVLAVPFLALAIALIIWKGPRLLAGGGMLTGHGLMWLVLLLRVQLTCGAAALFPDETCQSSDLAAWLLVAGAIFGIGLVASASGLERARHVPGAKASGGS